MKSKNKAPKTVTPELIERYITAFSSSKLTDAILHNATSANPVTAHFDKEEHYARMRIGDIRVEFSRDYNEKPMVEMVVCNSARYLGTEEQATRLFPAFVKQLGNLQKLIAQSDAGFINHLAEVIEEQNKFDLLPKAEQKRILKEREEQNPVAQLRRHITAMAQQSPDAPPAAEDTRKN